jgi:hypothetical protein
MRGAQFVPIAIAMICWKNMPSEEESIYFTWSQVKYQVTIPTEQLRKEGFRDYLYICSINSCRQTLIANLLLYFYEAYILQNICETMELQKQMS